MNALINIKNQKLKGIVKVRVPKDFFQRGYDCIIEIDDITKYDNVYFDVALSDVTEPEITLA